MKSLLLSIGAGLLLVFPTYAAETRVLSLQTNVQVDSEGVFLHQVAADPSGAALPAVRLAAPPAFGQSLTLQRSQIHTLLAQLSPDWATTNLSGAASVRVTRRARAFAEADVLELLTSTLQRDIVRDRGTLELRLSRAWAPISLPDEPLTLKVLDLPTAGVTPAFIVRFELRTAHEAVGTWQASLQAKVLREIWVTRATLKRGDPLRDDDVVRERRDLLPLRDVLTELPAGEFPYELAETVPAGLPLTGRSFRLKSLVHRGQSAEAVVRDGSLSITMKVEVLEDGAPGQFVRARNQISKRELRGKVINEQTLLIAL